jgi:hypothetical protein
LNYSRYRFGGTQIHEECASINMNSCLRLLFMVLAICLPGFAGCSSVDAGMGNGFHSALIGKMDAHPNEDEDVVAANRDWYQMID